MQTETRRIRIILSEAFDKKHNDPLVISTADRIYKEITGKENPKRGDALGGWIEMGQAQQAAMQEVTEILQTFERELRRRDDLAGNETWRQFARRFVISERDKGHDYNAWLAWFRSDPKRMEWAWKETPETIKARWMMAFEKPVIGPRERVPSGV